MMVGKQRYRKALKQRTALLAIATAGLFAVNPAHANCSDSTPGAGDMVICGPGAPNPDPVGVYDPLQSIPNLPVDVTVDVLDGAIISGIYLGRDATIRTEAGSRIDGSLRPGVNRVIHVESGTLDLAGEIVNAAAGVQIDTSAASSAGSSLILRETGSITSGGGSAAILMQGSMGRLQIDGSITSNGSNVVPAGSVVSLGNDMTTIVGATGSVTTTGDFMSAVVSAGNGNLVQLAGSIATAGEFAAGITMTPGLVNNFSTLGDDAGAIIVGSAMAGMLDDTSQTITITDSTVSTVGDRSGGIFVNSNLEGATNSDFGILVSGVEISTLGEDSHALQIIGAQNVQAGDLDNPTPNPTNGDVFSSVAIGASDQSPCCGRSKRPLRKRPHCWVEHFDIWEMPRPAAMMMRTVD